MKRALVDGDIGFTGVGSAVCVDEWCVCVFFAAADGREPDLVATFHAYDCKC